MVGQNPVYTNGQDDLSNLIPKDLTARNTTLLWHENLKNLENFAKRSNGAVLSLQADGTNIQIILLSAPNMISEESICRLRDFRLHETEHSENTRSHDFVQDNKSA